ncbi:MAG: aconitate hydratase AcnA [Phycisphaerales bacterium]|nr:aconitate hydratase AcnA [Planctomycetota bacterium]MCH8509452.1 aconitate hydratase AcnA [Phycisphaerales bacterium]
MTTDPFHAQSTLTVGGREYRYVRLRALEEKGMGSIEKMPFSIRVLLEAMIRNLDGFIVTNDDIAALAKYDPKHIDSIEMPFMPGRVVLQDFTGVPCVVDLAAMRDAMRNLGGDPAQINPAVACDLVIDHSVQVDDFATRVALTINAEKEFERNNERYTFLKWGQESLDNFRVVPPATGIVHQVNLEYLARGCLTKAQDGAEWVYPDSLVGTDSHTTMINGVGVLGWGVGGIEAEAVMLGQPVYMLTPEVVGFKLTGKLPEGATATDLVLTVTQMLRAHGVVEKFVEFFGPGMAELSVPDRATIANMAPEYGATCGFFPIDKKTIEYFRLTAKTEHELELTEAWARAAGFFWEPGTPDPEFTNVLELDLSTVVPSLAGPKRPQDRVALSEMRPRFHKELVDSFGKQVPNEGVDLDEFASEGGQAENAPVNPPDPETSTDTGLARVTLTEASHPRHPGQQVVLRHGSVVIAAITSCTNTSNPDVMIAAGLVARKARARGLTRKPWVKTSLAPGSKVVTEYFDKANLTDDLEALGFHTVGYGCTTCIGNSGPLPPEIEQGIKNADLIAASVLSGNRNFEGRVHPAVKANYLASPPLVVAYAIAGTVDIDLAHGVIGKDKDGNEVRLKDIWPTKAEIDAIKAECVTAEQFGRKYAKVYDENETWNRVPVSQSELFPWDDDSTYIQNPPFFEGMTEEAPGFTPIRGARCLALLGDSVTTDHISPAGRIEPETPAGQHLIAKGVHQHDFNSYGSRRGNDRVMTRGTFANVRVKNKIAATGAAQPEGGWTRNFTKGATIAEAPVEYIFDAAMDYKKAGVPLVVVAGKDYGMGSSRDWAAKGAMLLGVKAVIAESFERIHRSNLVFMGVMPLVFKHGQSAQSLGLRGDETFDIAMPDEIAPRCDVAVTATAPDGKATEFTCVFRVDTAVELEYFRNGGILHTVIRKKLNEARQLA